MRYACVFAHQDDEMRCLGTLLRLREAGHEIAFVTLTNGDKGLPFDREGDAAATRAAEMSAVAAALDAPYRSVDREDGFLSDCEATRRELIRLLRELAPEVVFTHWTADYNPDHVATARLVTDAALFTTLPSFEPDVSPLDRVPRILHTDPGPGYGFEATHFVELSDAHAARKAELIRLHHSQMDVMRQLSGTDYADQMDTADRATGWRLMVSRAEAFRPCLAERRVPWPADLPGSLRG